MNGLTQKEAATRLAKHGPNTFESAKRTSPFRLLLSQFSDVLVLILLAAAGVSLFLGDVSEALTIGVILLVNAALGFLQEFHTERALERLKQLSAPRAVVIRDGKEQQIDAALLVPGDLVRLSAGNIVPADGILAASNALSFDESMLTGESFEIHKSKGDQVFSGCTVLRGNGYAQIKATGRGTEMGKIAGMLNDETAPTPLQERLSKLGAVIGITCLLVCALVAVIGILRGFSPLDMLLTGVSLAVAAVPEGLPAIVTVSLALAVGRMVRRKALIRKLHAVETLGCATVICSDKTGTLTQNKMQVATLIPSGDEKLLHIVCRHCNNREGPTECALFDAVPDSEAIRLEELPFDSHRKRMSVLVEKDGIRMTLTKGAPDLLLPLCTHFESKQGPMPMSDAVRNKFLRENERLGSRALRTLAFAYRIGDTLSEQGLVFCGFAGLIDPPRKDVKAAISTCRKAGIRPIMITGDHAATARAIAEEVGILKAGGTLLTGAALDALSEEELLDILPDVCVFARVTPTHKQRIVKAFQTLGEVVAMTGDGVNDAPAVKSADIGVAMGTSGTDVTRAAASVVLLDDSFATLVRAVEEGRGIYANIRKFIRYLLACNLGEVCTMLFAMLFSLPIPLIPIQILFVNLVTDGLPAIALGLEPCAASAMTEPPRSRREGVFSRGLGGLIFSRGLAIGVATVVVFFHTYHSYGLLPARTCSLTTLIFAQLLHVFECKSETHPLWCIPLFNNPALVGAALLSAAALLCAIYLPPLAHIFDLIPLTAPQFFFSCGISLALPLLSGIVLRIKKWYNSTKGGMTLGKLNKR